MSNSNSYYQYLRLYRSRCQPIVQLDRKILMRCALVYLMFYHDYDVHIIDYFVIFQQTSSGMFGLGNSQTRCVKSYSTAPINDVARLNPMRLARLIWINNRTVTLMLADGSETRFNV